MPTDPVPTGPAPTGPVPLCPVTGEPAVRLVQRISARLLIDLWRIIMRVDARPSFQGTTSFGLWESPTGLYFFDPMLVGDEAFYKTFYAWLPERYYPHEGYPRGEFLLAARQVREGERVLDVGCGPGPFRYEVRHAHYTGLDPYFSGDAADAPVRAESLADHLASRAQAYDVCTAFQVVEHVADPVGFVSEMARAVRPGGRVMIGVPHRPAVHTRLPNNMINAVPHHLTWWTEAALLALADRVGLVKARVATTPWTACEGMLYWAARCTPLDLRDRYYRHAWSWHAATLLGSALGWLMWQVRPVPNDRSGGGPSLLLVAEKPDAQVQSHG